MSGRKIQCMKPVCLEEDAKSGCGLFGKVAAAPVDAEGDDVNDDDSSDDSSSPCDTGVGHSN